MPCTVCAEFGQAIEVANDNLRALKTLADAAEANQDEQALAELLSALWDATMEKEVCSTELLRHSLMHPARSRND